MSIQCHRNDTTNKQIKTRSKQIDKTKKNPDCFEGVLLQSKSKQGIKEKQWIKPNFILIWIHRFILVYMGVDCFPVCSTES